MDEQFSPIQPQKPQRGYTTAECVYAWLCLFAGYLFWRTYPVSAKPMGGFLLILFLFSVSAVVLKIKGARFGALPVTAAVSAVVLSCALVLSANPTIQFFAYLYAIVIWCYFLYAATGNTIKEGFTDFIAADFFKALMVMPFHALGHLFRAMFSGKAKKAGKFLEKVLVGVGFAALPTVIVAALLSYDRNFSALLEKLFDFESFDLFSHFLSILGGIPVGMFLYGAFIASSDHLCRETMTEERCRQASSRMKAAPVVTVLAAVLPLLFLYVVFFVSQWHYYVSGFTGVLPESFSYAEYAREGFFQLCIVSVINLLVIAAVAAFMRRKNKTASVLFKLLALIFSVFTLVLISTAIAKLVMYIDYYGLTPKRVHAAWFMAVLAVVFILIAVKQFASQLNVVAASIAVLVVMFGGLSLTNVDGYIAKYNVDRYVAGTLDTVDVYAMEDLGLAGVPQMVRLARLLGENEDDPLLYADTAAYLKRIYANYFEEEAELVSLTLPYLNAKKALETLPLT